MSILFSELKEKLIGIDEITLLERLDINSEELVERFSDKIEDRMEELVLEFKEEDEDE